MMQSLSTIILAAILFLASCRCGGAALATTKLKLENKCEYKVWPGIAAANEQEAVGGGGMELEEGESVEVEAPAGWSGRVWARTGCEFDARSEQGYCETGDCGGVLRCGSGGAPPVTLAEFTLAGGSSGGGGGGAEEDKDFYDVSLVDGYNVAVAVTAVVVGGGGGEWGCAAAGCLTSASESAAAAGIDLMGGDCPAELEQRDSSGSRVVACRSACDALGDPAFCCTGDFSTPEACSPSSYSRLFKAACPAAYSFAYDDPTSTFTCSAPSRSYTITFCPLT